MSTTIKFEGIMRDKSAGTGSISITEDLLPTTVDTDDNTTSISYNTVLGDFVDFPIALKRKVIMKWDILSDSQLDTLYYNGILSAIKSNGSRFFKITVTGNDELKKKIESVNNDGIFYVGTPVKFSRLSENNNITYWSGELHFIQVSPYTLNNPTSGIN